MVFDSLIYEDVSRESFFSLRKKKIKNWPSSHKAAVTAIIKIMEMILEASFSPSSCNFTRFFLHCISSVNLAMLSWWGGHASFQEFSKQHFEHWLSTFSTSLKAKNMIHYFVVANRRCYLRRTTSDNQWWRYLTKITLIFKLIKVTLLQISNKWTWKILFSKHTLWPRFGHLLSSFCQCQWVFFEHTQTRITGMCMLACTRLKKISPN